MKNLFKLTLFVACFQWQSAVRAQDIILEQLSRIEGLRVEEKTSTRPGYRLFDMHYRQPADHRNPAGASFEQRLVLWHRDAARPMVLQTSGYSIFGMDLSSLAVNFRANQIQVEHRYFSGSLPENADWSLLNIEQSAADFHRITVAFKSIYQGRWTNTGRSKGGMTSVYHRYFYPDDVDATVAHVAPHSLQLDDERYVNFVANEIGGSDHESCRAKLLASQKILLRGAPELLARVEGSFDRFLGSPEVGLEHAILEYPWAFWQYAGPDASCSNVPAESASLDTHADFFFSVNSPTSYSDAEVEGFVPYYHQAAEQLGTPGTSILAVFDLLHHADTFNIFSYLPRDRRPTYDNARTMQAVSRWIAESSERMLFVYGAYDPWTAGAFEPRVDGDSYLYQVAKKNHSAQFSDLAGADRDFVFGKIRSWLDIQMESQESPVGRSSRSKNLDDLEFEALRRSR